jgi:aspartate/methionine/tyrosine aminotransferase
VSSATKTHILEQHQQNTLLTTSAPALMMRSEHDLSADEGWSQMDERMIASAAEALEAGQTHYVDVPGIAPLRTAIAEHLRAAFGASYQQPNMIVTAGMQESRFLTIQMIGAAVERVGIPSVVHPGVRRALGVRALPMHSMAVDAQMLPTLEGIREALQAGCRLLFLESPSRLTGAIYSAESVAQIAALAAEFEALVIWDQGLAPWASGYTSLAASAPDHTIAIGEAFPNTGLASWFIGYIAAPEQWVAPMQSQKQIMAICTSTAAQYAALEASKLFAESARTRLEQLERSRQTFIEALGTSAEIIAGATAAVLAVRPADKDEAMMRLTAEGYTPADGADFGAPALLRLTLSPDRAALIAAARIFNGS